jgi:peptide/nickel transport system substrate-binding protein
VAEVDLCSGQTVSTTRTGNGPSAIALGHDAVWVTNALDSTVSKIDPASGAVVATIPVGSGPTAVTIAPGSAWVANQYSKTVSRIDPGRNAVAQTIALGNPPTALDKAGGKMWVGVQPLAQHRGGTLVLLHQRPISIDPALHVDLLPLVSDALTRDGLLTYNHAAGPAGIRLVPDLAVSVPLASDRGRTYTFRLRPHIRYSDGQPLRAADFRRSIERVFQLGSEGHALFRGIRGADGCNAAHCDLRRGIVTDERARTVSVHLRAPDPDFLRNLTEHGLATAVPAGTPFHDTGLKPIPGTGPYKIASASEREIRYVRNPLFREWSHAARPQGNPDSIVLRFGFSPAQEVRAIEEGRADWMADNIPARLVPALARRFGSQLHSAPIPPTTDFLQFNTNLPPFDDVRVRRALNLAIDRRAVVRIYGGPKVATTTCQPLPEGLPGFRRYCPYTQRPTPDGTWKAADLARAQRLVEASDTRGTPVTVWGWTDDPTISPRVVRYTAAVLRRLGYPTRVRLASHSFLPVPLSKIQLIPGAWGDTTDGFLTTLFSCAGVSDHGWFCDRRVDRAIVRARAVRATRPRQAAALWARIDRDLTDQAASVPLIDEHAVNFVSARVRNYQSHPYWGIIADQLWLR